MGPGGTRVSPMFPLGMVLVPGAVVPLHVFEPRYRALVRDVLDGDGEFGVVLIERGSEVGGDDLRSSSGTVARVISADELPDGRWAVVAVGDRRLRVTEWLADDPYPRAVVEDWPDESADRSDRSDDRYEAVVAQLRMALALASELGDPVPPVDTELPDEPAAGCYAVVALAPFGALDRQRMLATPGTAERLALLEAEMAAQIDTLRARLQLGDG